MRKVDQNTNSLCTGKFADLQLNAFEAFKVFIVSKQIPIAYSAPVKGPKKKVHDISYIYSYALMCQACSYPISEYLAVPLYLNVLSHFA